MASAGERVRSRSGTAQDPLRIRGVLDRQGSSGMLGVPRPSTGLEELPTLGVRYFFLTIPYIVDLLVAFGTSGLPSFLGEEPSCPAMKSGLTPPCAPPETYINPLGQEGGGT